jgi:hypothetical protein
MPLPAANQPPADAASTAPRDSATAPEAETGVPAGNPGPSDESKGVEEENRIVDLARLAWLITVLACAIAIAILTAQGYYGYALVTLAVAASAAINLT